MSREIKFRRFWKGLKAMIHFDFNDGELTYNPQRRIGMFIPAKEGEVFLGTSILMEYTGLKDKNEKQIYESDILKSDGGDIMLVKWNNKFACFCLEKSGWAFSHFFGEAVDPENCEVIGNLHENHELLETKEVES